MNGIITAVAKEYEQKLTEQKERISELVRENSLCREKIAFYEEKDAQISSAIKKAEAYSESLKEKSDEQYRLAVVFINNFIDKWKGYFDYLKEKYPMYPVVKEAAAVKEEIKKIISSKTDEKTVVEKADKVLSGVKKVEADNAFSPKKKIADYIAATEQNGFNMDEVLNPGALRLEDLCKELGLLTENDL